MRAFRVHSAFLRVFRIATIGAGLGAVVAMALCAIDIRHNGFIVLGFHRTVGLMIQEYLQTGILAGIGGALAAASLATSSRAIAGGLVTYVRDQRLRAAIATMVNPSLQFCVAVAIGIAINRAGLIEWKANRVWYLLILGGALVCCKVLLDWLLGPEAAARSGSDIFSRDLWFSFGLIALVFSTHVVRRQHLKLIREGELIAVAIMMATVVTGFVLASYKPGGGALRLRQNLQRLCGTLAAASILATGGVRLWASEGWANTLQVPNVILVTIDTLRADHLGCYNYERPVSPSIDSLAARATLFRRAIASSPWTLPSHASLFTGRNPHEHGVQTYLKSSTAVVEPGLSKDQTTIAEVFRELGYQTGAFVANSGYLGTVYGLNQGFETYEVRRTYARSLNHHVQNWIARSRKRPFFLFVNYMDTHRPYNIESLPDSVQWPVDKNSRLLDELIADVLPGDSRVPIDLAQRVVNQYDASIVNLDLAFGEFISWLKEEGLFDQTVIIVTSDHGEYFGEHNLVEHSKDVYEEALWVPFIVKGQGQSRGLVSDDLISLTDLPRLVLSELPGRGLSRFEQVFPDLPGNHLVIAENRYTRSKDLFHPIWGQRFLRVRTAVYDWPFKLILSSDGQDELFDVEADPKELRNLASSESQVFFRLIESLRIFKERRPGRRKPSEDGLELSKEQLEELRSLGYL